MSSITSGYNISLLNGLILQMQHVTTNTTLSSTSGASGGYSYAIGVDSTDESITITLPPSPENGRVYSIIDIGGNASSNNITIDGNGKNIIGSSTVIMNNDYNSVQLIFSSNKDQWFIL